MKKILFISTFIFIVGCVKDGEEIIETWDDGKPKTVNIWKDEEYTEVKYYQNGLTEQSGKFVIGKESSEETVYVMDGIWKYWYIDGTLKEKSLYESGTLSYYKKWYKNGQQKYEGKGSSDGTIIPVKQWNEDGSVK